MPATTTNGRGRRFGDPANLVVVGDFSRVLGVFGARWDETEVISLAACWKTFRAFLTGAEYRYSPVSALFLFDRARTSPSSGFEGRINETTSLAVVGHLSSIPWPTRLGRANQSRYRRPLYLADLEYDHPPDRP